MRESHRPVNTNQCYTHSTLNYANELTSWALIATQTNGRITQNGKSFIAGGRKATEEPDDTSATQNSRISHFDKHLVRSEILDDHEKLKTIFND